MTAPRAHGAEQAGRPCCPALHPALGMARHVLKLRVHEDPAAMIVTLAHDDASATTQTWGAIALVASLTAVALTARLGRFRTLVALRLGRA